ncbi:hypothetical protein PAPHI01_0240 [Pancytospora philotis]|nr:hypothetical protein PAPHI01_0240 [Pancytospora philotis]
MPMSAATNEDGATNNAAGPSAERVVRLYYYVNEEAHATNAVVNDFISREIGNIFGAAPRQPGDGRCYVIFVIRSIAENQDLAHYRVEIDESILPVLLSAHFRPILLRYVRFQSLFGALSFIRRIHSSGHHRKLYRKKIKKYLRKQSASVSTPGADSADCSICLSAYRPKSKVRKLDCSHEFHRKCIDRWLKKGNLNCPVCRTSCFSSIFGAER